MSEQVKYCSYGGESCGPQQRLTTGLCGMHYARYRRYGKYELICSVGGEACGEQTKLWDGKCREHHFYSDVAPCIEEGCDVLPTPDSNKFVGGRCPKHYQQATRGGKNAGARCPVGVGCGPQNKLYDGLCRRHFYNRETYGSYEPPACAEEGCNEEAAPGRNGLCSMHYQRARRADQRKEDLGVRLCPECGSDMSTARRNSKYCSEKCTRAVSNAKNAEVIRMRRRIGTAMRKAQKQGNPGSENFTVDQWVELVERLEYRCTYCGEETSADDIHMDHIVALNRGGPHAILNITPACSRCNISKKHRLILFEWAPILLGGRPRWDKTAPRGYRGNPWEPELWRDESGPLETVLCLAQPYPELMRATEVTEAFMAGGQPIGESVA